MFRKLAITLITVIYYHNAYAGSDGEVLLKKINQKK